MKRFISLLLVLTVLLGMVPAAVQAEETQANVENGNTTIEGTNGFGNLLSEEIQEQQAVQEKNSAGGYNVIGLTVENGIATVEYDTLEEAVLMVALYTEDGMQMLVSGNTLVQPEEMQATVTLEGEIPQYFMASAFLLDTYDYSPLCDSYDTPMYTREMQELLNSTVEDYDADKVLQLSDDTTTNFAVYSETTKILDYVEGVNTVISADDNTATYVIGNADENITGLQTGDVLAYSYGEDQILIVKVASISVDGTTATITGAELEMEEVFSHMKLEATGDTRDITVDESAADEGVTYAGVTSNTPATRAFDGENIIHGYRNFKIEKKYKSENSQKSVTLKGSVGLDLNVKLSYYFAENRQFIELKADVALKAVFSVDGEISNKLLSFPALTMVAYGIKIDFKPELCLDFSGEAEYSISAGFTIGFSYENEKGYRNLCTAPSVEAEWQVEGDIFLGIDLSPSVAALAEVFKAELEAPVGFQITAEPTGNADAEPSGDAIHSCEKCYGFQLSFKVELKVELSFLKRKWSAIEGEIKVIEIKIADAYWSLDRGEFGMGQCPYESYRVTVVVKDADGGKVPGVSVAAAADGTQTVLGATDGNGTIIAYLPPANYTFLATVNGTQVGKTSEVEEPCKIVLQAIDEEDDGTPPFISGAVDTDSFVDESGDGAVAAWGRCGNMMDDINWTLTSNGTLNIFGTGWLGDFEKFAGYKENGEIYYTEWNPSTAAVTTVIINYGVTEIGHFAFDSCTSLTSVTIPNSVTMIDWHAFSGCTSLTSINIPDSVTSVDMYAFSGCTSLSSVNIGNGLKAIGRNAFADCYSLTSITLPEGLTEIGYEAFSMCYNLRSVTIPASVTNICEYAFYRCHKLESVYITDLRAWCEITFDSDYVNPLHNGAILYINGVAESEIIIPDGITEIGDYVFHGCENLTSVTVPESVTRIGKNAFVNCYSLSSINIPDGVTSIGEYAFACCQGLPGIALPDSLTSIGEGAFEYCTNMTNVTIGDGITSIGDYAFSNCYSLTSITFTCLAPPSIEYSTFYNVTAKVQYPYIQAWHASGNAENDYGGTLTWVPMPCYHTCVDADGNYECDYCWDILPHTCVDEDGNYRCDYCWDRLPHDCIDEDGDYHCDYCEDTLPHNCIDEDANYSCDLCCRVMKHQCIDENGNYMCDLCDMQLRHHCIDDNDDGYCDLCGEFSDYRDYYHDIIDENGDYRCDTCLDVLPHECIDENGNYWCDLCDVRLVHECIDENSNYYCDLCLAPVEHACFDKDWNYRCDICLDQIPHKCIDEDGDYRCDLCDWSFEHMCINKDGDAACDLCGEWLEHDHIDEDNNYSCDLCNCWIKHECRDGDSDYYCDLCGIPVEHECIDGNGDYLCDICRRKTGHECIDVDGDYWCDLCAYAIQHKCVDEDGDYLCERCHWPVHLECPDENGDGLCDLCGLPCMLSGCSDKDGDSKCDFCCVPMLPTAISEKKKAPMRAIFGGAYETERIETCARKKASFESLVPGEEYVLLALASLETENILAPDNLLYIAQASAEADGTLVFTYVQRVDTDLTYVMACGASNKNLKDAVITFPKMTADTEVQPVEPTVVYEGKILTEGVDYTITGTVDYTQAGEYTCYIRGVNNYTGTVKCTYSVADCTIGDVDDNGTINILDVMAVINIITGSLVPTESQKQAADINSDNAVNIIDAMSLINMITGG